MELKSEHPLREWKAERSFNRTFMELKSGRKRNSNKHIKVLIVPLWN